jgi:hypothetical protein
MTRFDTTIHRRDCRTSRYTLVEHREVTVTIVTTGHHSDDLEAAATSQAASEPRVLPGPSR